MADEKEKDQDESVPGHPQTSHGEKDKDTKEVEEGKSQPGHPEVKH